MNLKNLFKHKLLEARTIDPIVSKEGLVYAVNYNTNSSSIYLYTDGENDIHLGHRWHTVSSLCVHNNWLYDGGLNYLDLGFVIDTITGKDIMERSGNTVSSLCSHNGKLYRGGWRGGVFEVLSGERIAQRDSRVTALCSHEGVLYDGGYYKGVYSTFRNEPNNKKKYVTYLCSNKNGLYGVDYNFDQDYSFNGTIFDVLKGKKIKNIQETLTSMCFYKDELYYSYSDMMIGVNDNWIRHNKKGTISAMCSIPSEIEEQIKHTKNYGFSFNEVQRINPKGSIEYLTNVSDSQERRRIIEQLFNYEHVHENVIDWLNKNEKDIMRKAAFY